MSEPTAQRRLAAILAADVVGYSKMMSTDETGTLAALKSRRKGILEPLVAKHQGRVFKITGDGVLIEFASAVNAVQCAVNLQHEFASANVDLPGERKIVLRMGVHVGDVMIEGSDLYGEGVNVAARLEAVAEPGGVLLSEDARRQVGTKLQLAFEDLGPQSLKNIDVQVRAYRVAGFAQPVTPTKPAQVERPSIAVLPLTNLSGDPDQEYFSDGITEDIITELSRFHEFAVIARNSSFRYKGQSPKIEDVGRDLGAKFILEGSVRKMGNRVRVTAQLVDSTSGAHIWAERYDRDLDDIFSIQDEVTEAVVARVAEGIKLAHTLHVRSRPPQSASAYDLVLQARPYRIAHTATGSAIAVRLLRQAIELDSKFALAHASLAFVLTGQCEEAAVADPDATLAEALSAGKQAVALDDSDGYAHASLAYVLLKYDEYEQAEREIGVALSLNPNHCNIIMTSAWTSVVNGDPGRAIELIQRARRLNPLMGGWELWTLGEAYLDAKRYQDALDSFAKVTDPPMFQFLDRAVCLAYLGRLEDAHRSLRTYLDRARKEMFEFPGEDPAAWRAFLHRYMKRRRPEITEHFIEGVRKAGLNVA